MARTLTPPSEDNIVTMALHRGSSRGSWHDGAVLYQSASRHPAAEEVAEFEAMVPHSARLGSDGLLLAGILPDARHPIARQGYAAVVRRAEHLGQKVVTSLDVPTTDDALVAARLKQYGLPARGYGPAHTSPLPVGALRVPSGEGLEGPDEEDLIVRALDLYALGMSGVGVGYLLPGSPKTTAVARMASVLHQHHGDRMMVTGRSDAVAQQAVLEAFAAPALPALRHDALWLSGWDAPAVRTAVGTVVRWSNARGAGLVWTLFGSAVASDPEVARLYHEPLTPQGIRRLTASILSMLALPGMVVLRQGEEVGLLDISPGLAPAEVSARIASAVEQQRGRHGSPFETYRTALRLRRDLKLGTGPLSWVTIPGLPTQSTVSYLNRNVLVVTNMGEDAVTVEPGGTVLHSSRPVQRDDRDKPVLEPDTTVWLNLP